MCTLPLLLSYVVTLAVPIRLAIEIQYSKKYPREAIYVLFIIVFGGPVL